MNADIRKLLIVGVTGFERSIDNVRVDCAPWESLQQVTNIRDYDTIVLDLLPLEPQERRMRIDWARFRRLLDFSAAADILFHSGKIIILGDPRFSIPAPENESYRPGTADEPFLAWTGVRFDWNDQPGDTIRFKAYERGGFAEFMRHLGHWDYSLEACDLHRPVISNRFKEENLRNNGYSIDLDKDMFCKNRYENGLAFALRFRLRNRHAGDSCSGWLVFLPRISLNEEETVQLVLRDICGVESNLAEPQWLSSVSAPGQQAIDGRIQDIKSALQTKLLELETAKEERAQTRRCLKLLYEREFALEPVVRETLRLLGATVEDPTEKNKEDGWGTVRVGTMTHEGVLEIKSTRSDQFGEDGRKQLLDWIDRGRTLRQKNYKGIFIGNSGVNQPPDKRPDAFSDSWKKAALLSQICALKSEHLYLVYILHVQKKLSLEDFWTQLFSTNGIFDVAPYILKGNPSGGVGGAVPSAEA